MGLLRQDAACTQGGNIGLGTAARADADGSTLLLCTSSYSVNPGLYESIPYDPFRDFALKHQRER